MTESQNASLARPLEPAQTLGRLIYGCMGLGGSWDDTPYGTAEVEKAFAAVDAALELGITFFDHADIYTAGKAEAVFGEVLAARPELRGKIQIQGKVGIRLREDGLATHYNLSRDAILARVNGSLERLRTDYLDVLLFHRPDPLLDRAEAVAAVRELMAEGKVRALGVSNMNVPQMEYLQDALDTPLVATQMEMSLGVRDWLESGIGVNNSHGKGNSWPQGLLEYTQSRGIEVQAYGSLARGRYTGAIPAQDLSEAEAATAAYLTQLATGFGVTEEAVLLGWLMKHPARISPVIGSANPERILACAGAAEVAQKLTRQQWYQLWITARGNNLP